MSKYSPNLKPTQLHNHADAAEQLGVPRSNIVDLRSQVEVAPVVVAPLTAESAPVAPVQKIDQKIEKLSWRDKRRLAKTAKRQHRTAEPAVIVKSDTPLPPPPIAAQPVPAKAKLPQRAVRQSRHGQSFGHIIKPVIGFALMSLLLVAPFASYAMYRQVSSVKTQVQGVSEAALAQLKVGTDSASSLDFASAATAFGSAAGDFHSAHDQLDSVNSVLTPILRVLPVAGSQFSSAENILVAGEQLSGAAEDVTKAFTILSQLTSQLSPDLTQQSTTDLLVTAHTALRPAVPRLEAANLALEHVDLATVPEQYRAAIQQAQATVPVVTGSLEQLMSLSETMLTILGNDSPKRYLVIFQNNREQRATGGFIGSFAMVDINKGKVSSIEIPGGGPYDLLGNQTAKVLAPQPLHYVNPYWEMQDANWWPDFPTSAKKIQWFYGKAGGPQVDGVITLTPDIIEHMLAVTGPIDMPEYDVTVDQSNFYDVTQAQAERKYDDTRESKKFIADLTPRLLDKLFSLDAHNLLPVLQIFYNALNEKDILVFFNDVFLENDMRKLGWTGEVKQTNKDYLQVVDTNIAGGKTDAAITETIQHQADIQTDGSVIDTVTVTRLHDGATGDEFANVKNMDYMRLYVPQGSELISATGFSQPDPKLELLATDASYLPDADLQTVSGVTLIDESTHMRTNTEFGKTVFGNWVITAPGDSSRVEIKYRLPFTVQPHGLLDPADSYSLLVQKQPGSFNPLLLTNITWPQNYSVQWSYPNTTASLNQTLKTDVFAGIVLEQ